MSRYNGFPPATHVVDYLASYEERYGFPVERPVRVTGVTWSAGRYTVHGMTDSGPRTWTAPHVIAATGTWSAPFVPALPGTFGGRQWHTVTYPGPAAFRGSTVAVVGGANSGAQIAAELTLAAADAGTGGAGRANPVTWYTRHPPRWMPDDVDGRGCCSGATGPGPWPSRVVMRTRGRTPPSATSSWSPRSVVPVIQGYSPPHRW